MFDNNKLLGKVKKCLDEKRFNHSLSTAEMAQKLAQEYSYDTEKAYRAGLLHDICRGCSHSQLELWISESRWQLDIWEKQIPALIHSPASAARAEKEFGVNDSELLEAVRYHSIGYEGMNRLTSIIFLADKIDASRSYPGVVNARKAAFRSLEEGLIEVCRTTIGYLLENDVLIHPNILILRNSLLRRKEADE